MLYNDAYVPILQDRHPEALGQPTRGVWPEIWSIIGPMLQRVWETGQATWSYDFLFSLLHQGVSEDRYFTFSFIPIRDETGRVSGVLCPTTETTKRVQNEQREHELHREAEAAREQLTATLESITDGFYTVDSQWRFTYVNQRAKEIWGQPQEDFLGKSVWNVFPEAAHLIFGKQLRRAMTDRVTVDFEGFYPPLGVWLALRVYPAADGLTIYFQDVTARKRAGHAVNESEARYCRLFEAMDEGFCIIEKVESTANEPVEFRYVEANTAFAVQTGVSDVVGKTIGQVFPSEPQDWRDMYDAVLRTGEPRKFEHLLIIQGRELELYAFRVDEGMQRRVAVLFKDITTRKQAEEARLRLAAIVDSSDDAIISKSLDGVITSWNTGAERLFGYRAEEMIGQSILRLLPEDRHAEEDVILARLRRGERIDHFETVRRTKVGRLVDVSVTISPLRDEQGKIIGASKIARDITERKRAEAERERLLTELQRVNAELQQFAYIVSHDLTEPLRTIHSFMQLLTRRTQGLLNGEAAEDIAFITDATKRLQQMLADLLAYTRAGQPPEFSAVDCEVVLAEALMTLHTRITESGAVITHEPLPTVFGDATRLGQVFQNLLGNALKFCEAPPPCIHLSAVKEDHYWRFALRDNGIGIEPQYADRIFQIFQRLHTRSVYPGTGMGLAICKQIIEQHGGRIWVESTLGEGSTFFLTLPAIQEENTVENV